MFIHALLVGTQNGIATQKRSLMVSYKVNHLPTPRCLPWRNANLNSHRSLEMIIYSSCICYYQKLKAWIIHRTNTHVFMEINIFTY